MPSTRAGSWSLEFLFGWFAEVPVAIIARRLSGHQSTGQGRERIVGCVPIALLLGALGVRTEPLWIVALAGPAIAILGWHLTARHRRRWAVWTAVNLALLLAVVWASTERSTLEVVVDDGRVAASVGAARLQAASRELTTGGVAIALGPADERPMIAGWAYHGVPLLDDLATWLNGNLLLGIDGARVDGSAGTLAAPSPTIWQPVSRTAEPVLIATSADWSLASHPRSGVVVKAGDTTWRDYRLTVPILRPSTPVRSFVLLNDGGDAIVVTVAPDDRTFTIDEWRRGAPDRRLAGGLFAYKRDAVNWSQAILREVLRTWLFTLTLIAAGVAVGTLADRTFTTIRWPPPAWPTALVLGIPTLAATLLVATIVLESIPHVQDSVTYLFQAEVFALGRLSVPAPPLPEFFEQEFVLVHGGQWFGKYPPGQPLVLALGVLVGAPWLVSPLVTTGAVVLTYLTGRELYGSGTGIIAALLVATSPFFLMMAGSMMSHPVGLFWAALLVYAAVRCQRTNGPAAWLVVGLAFGMLAITRQLTALAFGGPLLALLAAELTRSPRLVLARVTALASGALPPIGFLLFFNWRLVGDPLLNPYELWWSFDRIGFGPDIGMHGGHDAANGLANTFANLAELLRHLYGWPAYLTLAPALIPFALLSRRLWDWALGAAAAGLIIAYVAHWADGIMFGPRYYYEAIGALGLLTARGLVLLGDVAGRTHRSPVAPDPSVRLRLTVSHVTVATLVGILALVNLLGYLPPVTRAHVGYNGVSRSRLALVEQSNVGRALVFVAQQWPDWQPYGSVFPANGPLLDRDVIYARDKGIAENRRLMAIYPDRRPYLLKGSELTPLGP